MEKTILAVIIIGVTIVVVTVWISVDFCLYRERKKAAREKKVYMFYHYGRQDNKRLGFLGSKEVVSKTKVQIFEDRRTTARRHWRRLFDLFCQQKKLGNGKLFMSSNGRSEVTSSGVSDCLTGNHNLIELKSISENYTSRSSRSNSINSIMRIDSLRKTNSLTPCELLPQNRMALSPIEMETVFAVKDDTLLHVCTVEDYDDVSG